MNIFFRLKFKCFKTEPRVLWDILTSCAIVSWERSSEPTKLLSKWIFNKTITKRKIITYV